MQATGEDLIAHARQRLAPFKVPKVVHFVADLPRNASGKILKRELVEWAKSGQIRPEPVRWTDPITDDRKA